MKKTLAMVVASFLLIGGGCTQGTPEVTSTDEPREGEVIMNEKMPEEEKVMKGEPAGDDMVVDMGEVTESMVADMKFTHAGSLVDVTDGAVIRGISTGGNAAGEASFGFDGKSFMLHAAFRNLPEPQGGDFYEGWLVRRGPNFNFISTGELDVEGGDYVNRYASGTDWTDHDLYVLTLEPDDGDPAPADHIVEGVLTTRE